MDYGVAVATVTFVVVWYASLFLQCLPSVRRQYVFSPGPCSNVGTGRYNAACQRMLLCFCPPSSSLQQSPKSMSLHEIDRTSASDTRQDEAIICEDIEAEEPEIGRDGEHGQSSAKEAAEEEDQAPAAAPPTSANAANARSTFGLKKPKPAVNRSNDTYDYEQRYPEDALYAETAPNARVWRTYEDESRIHDTNMVEEARDNVDVLLVFAGLFSAVVTTLVVQTSQSLQVDYAAMSASLLYESVLVQRAIANGSSVDTITPSPLNPTLTFVPATTDVWVNGLWFTSLFLSLTTALVAVLVKQWLHHYIALPSGTPRDRSFTRQFRYTGFQKWHVQVIIGLLPVLMHLALAIFLVGLVLFLQPLRQALSWTICAGTTLVYAMYMVAAILPILFPQCPYRTPLCDLICCIIPLLSWDNKKKFLLAWRRGELGNIVRHLPHIQVGNQQLLAMSESNSVRRTSTNLAAEALDWLFSVSSNPSVRSIVVQSIGGLPMASEQSFLDKAYDKNIGSLHQSLLQDCLLYGAPQCVRPVPGMELKVGRLLRFGRRPYDLFHFCATPDMDSSDLAITILGSGHRLHNRETLERVRPSTRFMHIVRSSKLPLRCWYGLIMTEPEILFCPLDPGHDNHSNMFPLHICSAILNVFGTHEVVVSQDFDLPLVVTFADALPHFFDEIYEHVFHMFSKFVKEPSLGDPSLPPSLRAFVVAVKFLLHTFPPSESNIFPSHHSTVYRRLRVAISGIPARMLSSQEATVVITVLEDIIASCAIQSFSMVSDWGGLCNVTFRAYQSLTAIAPSAYSLRGLRSMINFMTIHWDQPRESDTACQVLTDFLKKRIKVAFTAFLENQCLQFLESHSFHVRVFPFVRGYVAGIFAWKHRTDGAMDDATLQLHINYLHNPSNLFTACSILAAQSFENTDRTAIHRDIMMLVQLCPRDAAWGECRRKLHDLVQGDGGDFFSRQRVSQSLRLRSLWINEIQVEKDNIRYAIQVLDGFFDDRAHTGMGRLDRFLGWCIHHKPEDRLEQEQPV
ncbi:hypothetical protein IW261DRAFT_1369069 [Armillaria novae-zelandiae]|uniref:DUF6535 domain-containing protein n=1 Tax=Armillaria novae-zelandiae TaxID=153914 RepID=A0AA39NZH7_9AGAR|nr:hypothetical protein IW261DRAFT_1369069 [Armillaria novae-zelandiae]